MPSSLPQQVILHKSLAPFLFDENLATDSVIRQSAFKEASRKLLLGTHNGDLEHIKASIYSMRLGGRARLLLVSAVINTLKTWVAIEFLWEHEYHQSQCLERFTPKELKAHIIKSCAGQVFTLNNMDDAFTSQQAVSLPLVMVEDNRQFVTPTTEQQEIIHAGFLDKKEVVCGEAGSGKTLIMLQRINELASILDSDESSERPTLWVVVPNIELQRHLLQNWQTSLASQMLTQRDIVQFVTPSQLYKTQYVSSNLLDYSRSLFSVWLTESDHNWMTQCQHHFGESIDPSLIYQELCTLIALKILAKEDRERCNELYADARLRGAFLSTEGARSKQETCDFLHGLLISYQAFLNETSCIDAYLIAPAPTLIKPNDFVFMDEAQNLPPGLFVTLARLKSVIFMNASQSTHFKQRTIEIFYNYLFPNKQDTILHRLEGTHRCPTKVVALANLIEDMKKCIDPKAKQATTASELRATQMNTGRIYWGEGCETSDEMLTKLVQSPDTATFVLNRNPGLHQWVESELKPLCLFNTDKSSIGLEFSTLVLFEPFELPQQVLNQSLMANPKSVEPLSDNQMTYWTQHLNDLRGAITRSTDRIIIVQRRDHRFKPVCDWLISQLSPLPLSTIQIDEKNNQAFYDQAERLYQQGHHDMAFRILAHINVDKADFVDKFTHHAAAVSRAKDIEAIQSNALQALSVTAMTSDSTDHSAPKNAAIKPPEVDKFKKEKWLNDFMALITPENVHNLINCKVAEKLLCFYYVKADTTLLQYLFETQKIVDFCQTLTVSDFKKFLEIVGPYYIENLQNRPELTHGLSLPALILSSNNGAHLCVQDHEVVNSFLMSNEINQEVNTSLPLMNLNCKGANPLRILLLRVSLQASFPNGLNYRRWVVDKLQKIAPYITESGLNGSCSDLRKKGLALFDWIMIASNLTKPFNFFRPLESVIRVFTKSGLNTLIQSSNGYFNTPLLQLFETPEGQKLFLDHGDEIIPLIDPDVFNRTRTYEALNSVVYPSPINALLTSNMAVRIMKKFWTKMLQHNLIRADGLNASSKFGGVQGISIVFFISNQYKDREYFSTIWKDIRVFITIDGMNNIIDLDSKKDGLRETSTLHSFCSTNEGIQFMDEHWDDFKELITWEGLHQPLRYKGSKKKPVCAYEELQRSEKGRNFIERHQSFLMQLKPLNNIKADSAAMQRNSMFAPAAAVPRPTAVDDLATQVAQYF